MAGLRPCATETRTPSAGSISDLAIEAGSHALPLTFARAHPAPFSPTANRSPSSSGNRRVKLTLAGATRPKARFAHQGRCVSPTSATDLRHEHPRDRSILESPRPPLSPEIAASMPPPPGRNLGGEHDRVEPRLTARVQLRHGQRWSSVSRGAKPRSDLMGLDQGPSERRSLFPALSAGSEGRDPASDTLCRAPSLGFTGFDSPPREEPPGPLPPAASSKAARFLDPERLPSPTNPTLPACAMLCRAPPTTSAIRAIHEHSPRSPETPVSRCPMGWIPPS